MVKQTEVVETVLKELGIGKLAIADAVAKAEAIKPMKNKNKVKNWTNLFKKMGTIVDGFVTAKVVATPAPEVPKAEPVKTA